MSGLFSTLNVGKRGLYAQQGALDVTSHNIANSNTKGYTRQRALMETTRPFGMPSMDNQVGPGQIGTGVEISKIQRVRDTFMDYQVRRETSTLGQYEARDKYLSEIEGIFNEPSDTGMSNLIGKFFDSWEELSKHPEDSNARTVVAHQAAALADELNHTHSQLDKVKKNAQDSIKQSVYDINSTLDRIDKLNQQIMSVKISGMEPNDLMDKRDLLLDELSKKFNVVVEQDKFGSINLKPKYTKTPDGAGEVSNPLLVRKNPNDEVMKFSYIKSIEKKMEKDKLGNDTTKIDVTGDKGNYETTCKITYLKNGDKDRPATFNLKITSDKANPEDARKEIEEKIKRLDESRVIWSTSNKNDDSKNGLAVDINGATIEEGKEVEFNKLALFDLKDDEYRGELKGFMSVQKDVDDYMDQMDKLAKGIAFSVNTVHSGKVDDFNKDIPLFFVNKEKDNDIDINAGNITINKDILNDVMKINVRANEKQGETDGSRALAIAELRDALLKIQDITSETTKEGFIKAQGGNDAKTMKDGLVYNSELGLYTIKNNVNGMKVDSYFKDVVDKLGIQEQEAQRIVKNQGALLKEFSQRRESISGVSLNEEMANIVQYQHAYQANAKIIATTDQLLDVVINGLKR
ncbi:flagellar hook protein FlgK [Clostridium novyi A str. BKT29909]|uniref:flagellar hook-associated protein FlgK n=1 Tax=Clostridium novyi TaxID=1542 RepID=UPI0004D3DD0C|nr:flagellar hook-associated protein FlgK [Clostridium novyi]KEH89019.1 flagellar hook protein FlgK [Clostridium novyi A str. BKT29909]